MLPARAQALTDAFYTWEAWGRGWLRAPVPVELEPPLSFPPWHRREEGWRDDTRREHWLRRLWRTEPAPRRLLEPEEEVELRPAGPRSRLVELALLPKAEARFSPALALSWLTTLSSLRTPLAFEVWSDGRGSTLRLAYDSSEHALVASSLGSVAPRVVAEPAPTLERVWEEGRGRYTIGFEFALAREFVAPLGEPKHDALAGLLSALAQLREGEAALWQVLLVPVSQDWMAGVRAAAVSPTGHPFFADAPELTSLAGEKVSTPLYAAVIRVLVSSPESERPFEIAPAVSGALGLLQGSNALVPLSDTDAETLESDVLCRVSRRLGMILSARELSGLVTFPQEASAVPSLVLNVERPAPPRRTEGVRLGTCEDMPVRLSVEDRLRHLHVVGASGTGKSNLLLSMMVQDLDAGHGFALLDPHGDLADAVLSRVPDERVADVVVLDPTEPERVVGWNVLGAETESERHLLASDLVGAFRRLSTSWGDQMTTVLSNAVLSFLASTEPSTLVELRRFLVDEGYRRRFLQGVTDPYLRGFWETEWPLLIGRRPQAPILTRLDGLLRQRRVRDVLTLREGGLDFRALLDERRVLIARLAQGQIGRENAALLGSLLVSRLHQAGLSRADRRGERGVSGRVPFFVYLDEFQEVATPSMATLFSGIRKYGLGLTVAHQDLYQLKKTETELERAVLTNAHVRVAFRVDEDDARRLEKGLAHFAAEDLTSLPVGSALARIGGTSSDFRLQTALLPALGLEEARARREQVEAESRERYGAPRPPIPTRAPESPAKRSPERPSSAPVPPATPVEISTETSPRPAHEAPSALAVTPTTDAPSTEGRGGPEHRYLQSLVRSWAQERGYRADIEVELEEGGRVDLVITPGEGGDESERVAVEISVTTGLEHELENARKCLAAGFAHVALVSPKVRFRARLHESVQALDAEERSRVAVYAPEELLAWLQARPQTTERIAGYTVTTQHAGMAGGAQAAQERRDRLNRVIAGSLARLKRE